MKNKFAVGDRVVCYDSHTKTIGKIIAISCLDSSVLLIKDVNGNSVNYHTKQCRKLVKKKRREIWVASSAANIWVGVYSSKSNCQVMQPNCKAIRFVEAKDQE